MASLAAQRADQLRWQQQRVAIARALVQEPTSSSPTNRLRRWIAQYENRDGRAVAHQQAFGITVICNLHSLDLARSYCDLLIGWRRPDRV